MTLLMPKATAVWLVENTGLTFEQIAHFCNLHPLEVKAIADGEAATGIKGFDPIMHGQLTREELDITVQENTLVVTGKAADEVQPAERTFLHRGIAKRAFERRFQLADVIKVTNASFEHGLLNIDLKREVPEHKKPRKVEIGANDTPVIDGEAA